MKLSAVLFDMDGVLIDTDQAVSELWRGLAAEHGLTLTAADLATDVYGCAPEHTVETVFAPLAPDGRAEVLDRVRAAEPGLGFAPVPHAARLVRQLADAAVPLALVTGASEARAARATRALGLTGRFAASVTWGEAASGKPAPDCYLLAADRLGVSPADCLVFEDTTSGARAAATAGAVCVAVGETGRAALLASGARHVVPGFASVRFTGGADAPSVGIGEDAVYRFSPGKAHHTVAPARAAVDHCEGDQPWR